MSKISSSRLRRERVKPFDMRRVCDADGEPSIAIGESLSSMIAGLKKRPALLALIVFGLVIVIGWFSH